MYYMTSTLTLTLKKINNKDFDFSASLNNLKYATAWVVKKVCLRPGKMK